MGGVIAIHQIASSARKFRGYLNVPRAVPEPLGKQTSISS
uniref:Uncharacterized protein n=1 Tax=Pseudomonas aeruginosa TaxID=287 RepID=A0A7S6C7J6_PSEAI|nr:hypothetical protein [Pseudomonas aeruginosa]